MKSLSNATECAMMSRGVRHYLASEFPETSVDIAILVLIRIAVDSVCRIVGKEQAPILLSRLVNHFLLVDHYGKGHKPGQQ